MITEFLAISAETSVALIRAPDGAGAVCACPSANIRALLNRSAIVAVDVLRNCS
jgi:hypothetical protein